MTETKVLGRIERASFGYGGYQDTMFGLTVILASNGSVLRDFWGIFPPPPDALNRNDALMFFGTECCVRLSSVLSKAKTMSVDKLSGTPIEITLDGNALKSWRVLEEVL